MKIVVTGSRGYIGKEVAFRLQMMGYHVIDIDTKNGKDIRKDMPKCDVVIHCAARMGEDKSVIIYNTELMQSVLKKAKKIIFLSSAAVYGNNRNAKETDKLMPINNYGLSKQACEEMIKKSKKNYTIFRLSNVYSVHADHGIIGNFLNGSRIINGNGKKIRDFVRLEDIVPIICEAAITNKWKGIYNLSINKGISINELFKRMYPKVKPIRGKEIMSEILYSTLNNNKAIKKGFKSQTL